MKESFFRKIDKMHLEIFGPLIIAAILFPVIYLCICQGSGSAIFQMHDQLDETILNYVFTAKYFGSDAYEQMMCGIPSEGLKPFSVIFVPLYMIFDVYNAFLIQHVIVVITAFFGMYFCIKELTGSSVAGIISATAFSLLPVHSIYGNVVMGTPLLIFSLLEVRKSSKLSKTIGIVGVMYYGLSTGFVLSGWVALVFIFVAFIVCSFTYKKIDKNILISWLVLLAVYILCNIDLIVEAFSVNAFESHRAEYALNEGGKFLDNFFGILAKGNFVFEAESKHLLIIIPAAVALILLTFVKKTRKSDAINYVKLYVAVISSILGLAFLFAFSDTGFVNHIMDKLPGMLSSFNITRVYYFIPGAMYILLGISCAIIIRSLSDKASIIAYMSAVALAMPLLLSLVKDKDGIFYQNINQINNGQGVTGYMTMKNIYSESLMATIEDAIGKDMSSYRIVNIGISPVAALMHGFYTIDGYSNNYPLEYKHRFREIIAEELELNDYTKAYFDLWGNRCYAFPHELNGAYMVGKDSAGQIMDLHLNFGKMKEMNCRYIFSAVEITEYEKYGLDFVGDYTDDSSFWHIWVYGLK